MIPQCIVRECPNAAENGHTILGEHVRSCEEHYDAVWLRYRNAHTEINNIVEALHWDCRNLTEKGGE